MRDYVHGIQSLFTDLSTSVVSHATSNYSQELPTSRTSMPFGRRVYADRTAMASHLTLFFENQ